MQSRLCRHVPQLGARCFFGRVLHERMPFVLGAVRSQFGSGTPPVLPFQWHAGLRGSPRLRASPPPARAHEDAAPFPMLMVRASNVIATTSFEPLEPLEALQDTGLVSSRLAGLGVSASLIVAAVGARAPMLVCRMPA